MRKHVSAMALLVASSIVGSGQVVAMEGEGDGQWRPVDSSLKAGWKVPKSYLMAGAGFLSADIPSRRGVSVDGLLAEIGLGMKIGTYLAVEGRYFSAPDVSGSGFSGDLKGYGSGITAYLPLGHKVKFFGRYDILHIESNLRSRGQAAEADVDARAHAFTAGLEARITGKNYMRASWQRIEAEGNSADVDVYELAYLRRLF